MIANGQPGIVLSEGPGRTSDQTPSVKKTAPNIKSTASTTTAPLVSRFEFVVRLVPLRHSHRFMTAVSAMGQRRHTARCARTAHARSSIGRSQQRIKGQTALCELLLIGPRFQRCRGSWIEYPGWRSAAAPLC
jgi:hypothetical protein